MLKVELEEYIKKLPSLTWVKDSNFRYISTSERFIQLLGCASEKYLFDFDDFNQPWAQYADIYRNEDQQILCGKSLAFLHPIKLFNGKDLLIITRKFPFYDQNNKITGITGNITIATSPELVKNIYALQKTDFEICAINSNEPGKYQIDDFFGNTKLSKRESMCLFYLIRGKTAPDIADLLCISKRTVESHINGIKNKFDCRNKSEIIEKAIELGFISFIPSAFLISQFNPIIK